MVTLHTALVSLSDDTISNVHTLCIFKCSDNYDRFSINSEIDKVLNNINGNSCYRYCTKYHLSDDFFERFDQIDQLPKDYEIQKRALSRCVAKQYIKPNENIKVSLFIRKETDDKFRYVDSWYETSNENNISTISNFYINYEL